MKEKFAKLIDVKSIITLFVVGVFCFLAVMGRISEQQFMSITLMIITFYFTKKKEDAQ